MSGLTTHVLDTSVGQPAVDVEVDLARKDEGGSFVQINTGVTNEDGRVPGLLPDGVELEAGTYKLAFHVESYFESRDTEAFYPYAEIVFCVRDVDSHYHVPLLLSPFGYSTYRGS